jgi:hypothetical protein
MSKTCDFSQVHLVYSYVEESMSKLPWWLSLLVKIMFVDLTIAFFVAGWSWISKDFGMVSLSNRFFTGGAIAILSSSRKGLNMVNMVLTKETKNHAQAYNQGYPNNSF